MQTLENKSILLVISGGIAAYKALELIRLIRKGGGAVRCILTGGGAQFITPLSVGSLSGQPVYTDLFSLKDEAEMGHIRLSREADLVVVAPASANMIAKMAQGLADDA
jgi:phosphopantothenoylcysteine decarboxylase/phosphopantothenate--cysteine ligase